MANAKNPTGGGGNSVVGASIGFGASEAYKRLRTNLEFSLPDSSGCRVIGVTSSLKGEGKSTTSINLAYTIAQTGKNVLLIECDLRMPTYSKVLRLAPAPGFTNLLMGTADGKQVLQRYGNMENLRVITAGDVPPNPAELLSSRRTKMAIEAMKNVADVIVLDLPPVGEVTDAQIASRLTDGMIVVVRENYCVKRALDDTMRQLNLAEAKILGFVMTDSNVQKKGYYKKGYYKEVYGYAAASAKSNR